MPGYELHCKSQRSYTYCKPAREWRLSSEILHRQDNRGPEHQHRSDRKMRDPAESCLQRLRLVRAAYQKELDQSGDAEENYNSADHGLRHVSREGSEGKSRQG